jgi:hypothetical protein
MHHLPASLTTALAYTLCTEASPETAVCPLLDRDISRAGSPETGVCRKLRVVNGTSVQSGPVTDGYVPVQYERVVVISGFGKTRLNSASAYASTLVTIAAPVDSTGSVLFTPDVASGRLVKVPDVATGIVTVPPELESKTKEELLLPNEDGMEDLRLETSELVVLDVKLADEVVFTNPGGGVSMAVLTTVLVMADAELKGPVEVTVKVTVVEIELGHATEVGDVIAEFETP